MSSNPDPSSLHPPLDSWTGSFGRRLSGNVRRLHDALNMLLSEPEREQFTHCLNIYHSRRNVFDLVQTLKVILDSSGKRQLLPMLRLVLPRSDQLLFDQYTSEGLYLSTEGGESLDGLDEETAWQEYLNTLQQSVHPVCQEVRGDASSEPEPTSACSAQKMRKVTLTRTKKHEGLGFSIRGGSDHGVGLYVSSVEPGSTAAREGLRVGDQILTVNEVHLDNVTHIQAVQMLKGFNQLTMSVCSLGHSTDGNITNSMYSWLDPKGHSISPPPDNHQTNSSVYGMQERLVTLNMDGGQSLGLMIRGGAEFGLGIYVTGVDPGSASDTGGLKVGDQILAVNGQSFVTISHDEAVHILKTGHCLKMKLRDVGRLPYARTVVSETNWRPAHSLMETDSTANESSCHVSHKINSNFQNNGDVLACKDRPSSAKITLEVEKPTCQRTIDPPGPQVSLEQQAHMLLTEPQWQTMEYYLKEYERKHISVESLTMALFELLNTEAKLSMLSEVRGLVALQDLELYDSLVLNQEKEIHQAWHGGLEICNPQKHCIHFKHIHPDAKHNQEEDQMQASDASLQDQSRSNIEMIDSCKSSPRMDQPAFSHVSKGRTQLVQGCLNKSLKSIRNIDQPPTVSTHHTSLNMLHHSCLSSPQPADTGLKSYPHYTQSLHHLNQLSLDNYWDYNRSAEPAASVKFSSRSSSYEKSSICLRSPSSPRGTSPVPPNHLFPHLSPCSSPYPSNIRLSATQSTPDEPNLPKKAQKVISTDVRQQPRGATPLQLSDSGQTLSEDSGVDIAEVAGLCRDGVPCPEKSQMCLSGLPTVQACVAGTTRQCVCKPNLSTSSSLVRVKKNAHFLGVAIEGGANTRQPLPRIVTIQRGGSADTCGQLRVGQVILEVDGFSLSGCHHKEAARIIAEAFKTKDKDYLDLLVFEPGP